MRIAGFDLESLRAAPSARPLLALGALFAAALFMGTCTTYVEPNEVGIVESRLVPPRGIRPGLVAGGRIHFLLPGQRIHTFPTDLQVLELTSPQSEQVRVSGDRMRVEPAVEVNTSDGSKVRVDVTVLYRLTDAFTIMQQSGPGRLFENNALIPKCISALKKNLGEMLAEDFYDVHKRAAKQAAAQVQIADELRDKGISVEHVLLRQYYYNKEYQAQIEEKKIQDQLKFTRQSEAEAAKELAKKQEIEATGKANVAVETQRGTADVTRIQAEADSFKRKREAEGDLLVKLATAQGTDLENAAYRGAGSEQLVGLEMADVLRGLEVIVVPAGGKNGINPLDLEQALELFDVKEDAR
jgi:regulator of protease activity HflC (stomatin/prohibitin superfamily)